MRPHWPSSEAIRRTILITLDPRTSKDIMKRLLGLLTTWSEKILSVAPDHVQRQARQKAERLLRLVGGAARPSAGPAAEHDPAPQTKFSRTRWSTDRATAS